MRDQACSRLRARIQDAEYVQTGCRAVVLDLAPEQVCVCVVYGQHCEAQVGERRSIEIRFLECRVFARDVGVRVIPHAPVAGNRAQVFEIVGNRLHGPDQVGLGLFELELIESRRNHLFQYDETQECQGNHHREQGDRYLLLQGSPGYPV